MRIDVQALRDHVQETIADLNEEQTSLNDALQATDTFIIETKDSFEGKTADASRAYLEEVYKPVQQKTLEINKLMIATLQKYMADAEAQFGRYGIVDIPAIKHEYKRELEQMMQEEMHVYRELNQLIDEVNEFVPIESANLGQLEQLHYDVLREITLVEAKLADFDIKWNRKFRNVEVLQEELANMLTKVGNQTITPTTYQKGTIVFNDIEAEFLLTMQAQFGFSEEESEIMYKVYESLRSQSINEEETFKLFFAYMGSFFYGDTEKYGVEAWGIVSGTLNNEELKKKLLALGINEEEFSTLEKAIINQHNACAWNSPANYVEAIFDLDYDALSPEDKARYNKIYNQYKNTGDFAHMSVTLAAQLHSDSLKWGASAYSGFENGVFSAEDNAGYAGDIFGVFGADPSMSNDDYKADLDAVNLAFTMKNNPTDGLEIINTYYADINSGERNRSIEFLSNIGNGSVEEGHKILENQFKDHTMNYVQTDLPFTYLLEGEEGLEKHFSISLQFMLNLRNENNEWVEYEEKE
ncbi:T7SS effector LXG polymorphic toxin [Listeria goaensis]|uniref:T7SS effector LXG polymorphic toxin n=1 Tax=Listeria goaensis TaxID=1649188 RepID=UPI000B597F78|nr:T7SS effector LXG polymorphic toxin [Listeria goaensis]